MKKYTVKLPLRHNGVAYGIGDEVELNDSQSKQLLIQGVIELATNDTPPTEPPADSKPPVEPTNNDDDTNDDNVIVKQIVGLFNQWQGDGDKIVKKPNVDSVRDALDNKEITTDQRDTAWDIYNQGSDDKDGE